MTGSGRDAAASRLFALLVLVLGLLGMHGLAGSHHASAAAITSTAASTSVVDHLPGDEDRAGHDTSRTAAHPPGTTDGALLTIGPTSPGNPACAETCADDLAAVCVAVLAAAAVTAVLHRAARRRRLPVDPLALGAGRTTPPARRLTTGPDPVAELCISRT